MKEKILVHPSDMLDTDEAQRTTSLILQQASAMASQADEEVPLIYSTQMAAMVADLEMEDENKEPSYYIVTGEGMGQELNVSISFTGAVTPIRNPAQASQAGSTTQRVVCP